MLKANVYLSLRSIVSDVRSCLFARTCKDSRMHIDMSFGDGFWCRNVGVATCCARALFEGTVMYS